MKKDTSIIDHLNIFNRIMYELPLVTTLLYGKNTIEVEEVITILLLNKIKMRPNGNIQIKIFNGIIKTLLNIIHVLDLKNNLTSLGIINSNGCKYNIKDRILEIINRVLVIMKGQKCEKLIVHHFMTSSTPQKNEVIEKMNKILLKKIY
uniref:Retrovirus-related Pol polyprotein from transposon TNT 1-94-like beta-barrel domain-containing protein n=1 Tax=Physcomitrium patens TaxID=3218 RepID=A0A2K1JCU9_PHYPA|nr:hypothetical protein PHYPA_019638 [Physcomitrium patens]